MSEVEPLEVTLELPATEFMEHEGECLVRCPLNGMWVRMRDYYSEKPGQLLPLVGNVDYKESAGHWVDTGRRIPVRDRDGNVVREEPVMEYQEKPDAAVWKETVRILEPVAQSEPEGGTLSFEVHEDVGTHDKFGG